MFFTSEKATIFILLVVIPPQFFNNFFLLVNYNLELRNFFSLNEAYNNKWLKCTKAYFKSNKPLAFSLGLKRIFSCKPLVFNTSKILVSTRLAIFFSSFSLATSSINGS